MLFPSPTLGCPRLLQPGCSQSSSSFPTFPLPFFGNAQTTSILSLQWSPENPRSPPDLIIANPIKTCNVSSCSRSLSETRLLSADVVFQRVGCSLLLTLLFTLLPFSSSTYFSVVELSDSVAGLPCDDKARNVLRKSCIQCSGSCSLGDSVGASPLVRVACLIVREVG